MFRNIILSLLFSFSAIISFAQNPVKWTFSVQAVENEENAFEVFFHADIEDKWHMYSQHLPSPNEGPLPTIFGIDEDENIELIGWVEEENDKVHSVKDEAFGVQVNYFDGKVVFTQKIKLKEAKPCTVAGFITYMVCDDTKCLPPADMDFSIPIKP